MKFHIREVTILCSNYFIYYYFIYLIRILFIIIYELLVRIKKTLLYYNFTNSHSQLMEIN